MFKIVRNIYKCIFLLFSLGFLLSSSDFSSVKALTEEPELLIDLTPDGSSNISQFTVFDGHLYFLLRKYDDILEGNIYELWRTDGTSVGTSIYKSLGPLGNERDLIVFNGELYFTAYSEEFGIELWKTNGTLGGTQMLKDINTSGDSFPYYMTLSENLLYFMAKTSETGWELWKTNGSEIGTALVKDICPGPTSSFEGPYQAVDVIESNSYGSEFFVDSSDTLYFAANDCTHYTEPWKSDGTEVGTVMVKDINTSWESISSYSKFTPLELNNEIYFYANDGISGDELWKSDGTQLGTTLVYNISVGGDSNPRNLTIFNNHLYFSANDSDTYGREIWKSDGTNSGTNLLKNINPDSYQDSNPDSFFFYNDNLYFEADDGVNGSELWKTNGTEGGTTLVKDINIWGGGDYSNFTSFDDFLYFRTFDDENGYELWKTDGSNENTTLVADINPSDDSSPSNLIVFNNSLYFLADDGTSGREIWKISRIMPSVTPSPSPTPTNMVTPTLTPTPTVSLKITNINAVEVLADVFAYYYQGNTNIKFKGITHPLAFVKIVVNSNPKVCETTADVEGNFECNFAYIEDGLHTATITATTVEGEEITYPKMTLGINVQLEDTGNTMIESPIIGLGLITLGIAVMNIDKMNRSFKPHMKFKILR